MSILNFGNGVNENHSAILNILCQQRSGLNIVHFNARSLNGLKLDHVRSVFENSKVDVICVTETWFDDEVLPMHYIINGYNGFFNNRKSKKGGGVAIYCKTCLGTKLISKSIDGHIEFINLEIFDKTTKVFVSCIYNPSRLNSLEPFFEDFSQHVINYDFYVVCGDFNANLLIEDTCSEELRDLVGSVGLTIVNDRMPTRFSPNCRPSLLDLILLSDLKLMTLFDQISFVSDHDLLFCTLSINLNRIKSSRLVTYRDYNGVDFNSLYSELSLSNITDCWYQSTVDDKLDVFISTLQNIFNRHVPQRSFSIKNCSCPWYTSTVKASIRERNRCYNNWKEHPSAENKVKYNRARNHATLISRQAKKAYYNRKVNTSLPPGQLWKNIKSLGIHSKSNSDCLLDPDELNVYFAENVSENNEFNVENNEILTDGGSISQTFQFNAVNEVDVQKAIMKIRSNAVGEDGVSIKFLKMILPFVIGPLTHIYNHCITTSEFPSLWKVGRIIPIAKSSSAACPNDYRPVSILSVLAKIFESLMSKQITEYLDANTLLSPFQSGFRAAHSCTTAALKVLDDIRPEFDAGNISMLCLLDFSKAFDKVNHQLLCRKLTNLFGFSDSARKLISNYLAGRVQKVVVGDKQSLLKEIFSGVPQGSVLGPLLFSIFINDLFRVCKYVKVHAYADDIQIYISNRIGLIEDLCYRLNEDLSAIQVWAETNRLILNPKKSFILPISKYKFSDHQFPLVLLGNTPLIYKSKVKYLGFHINSKLSCNDHVNNVIRKVYFILRNLRVSSYFTPVETKRKLVIQLLLPHITYAAEVYSKLDSHSSHKLQVSFNNATRYVYNLNRFSSMSSWRKLILGCDLDDYLRMRNLLFLHRILQNKTPAYLYEKLSFGRSARCMTLIVPRFSTLCSSRFFFVNAIKLWNTLPVNIKLIGEKSRFKQALFEFITISN